MLSKEFTESEHTWGSISPISRRNQGILIRHPILRWVKGRVRTTLENTRWLWRVLKYIDGSQNPQIPLILEDISSIGCAPLLLEFLPLLEQIYKLESQFGLGWIDEYDYLFEWNWSDKLPDQDMLLSLAKIKQIIEGRVIYNSASFLTPKSLVEDYLENELYTLNPSQIAGVFLVIEFLHRRIKYLEKLREEHNHDSSSLFTQVKACKFWEKKPITGVAQQWPFIEFSVTRKAMDVLRWKKVHGLFYRVTANKTLGQAIALLEDGAQSSQRHERQHNIAAWSALEKNKCVKDSVYFNTKDEILAYMAGWDRDFQSIFQTMFRNPLYDPYVNMKNDNYSYNYWREDYRKTLLIGIICAYLLEQKIGKRNAIDILTFIHFRSWKSEIRRVFQINIPPAMEVLVSLPWKEKEIFQLLWNPKK